MNKPISPGDLETPKVTTGPLPASRKIHSSPAAAPDLRVPLREIVLQPSANEPPLPVYDTSGPYTDDNVAIDVERGLPRIRAQWVRERGGVEEYDGRPIKAVDNGNVTGKYLARNFPNTPKPMRGIGDAPVTQYEFARRGIVTKEMIYVAERENLGRKTMLERAEASACRRRELRRQYARLHHAGIRARRDRARPRHHPGEHQPRRARADDHRPQFSGEDQRQHRQLRRFLFRRGGNREDGMGDPLGRRHGDGPLHRPQHPQHARMDLAQLARADRHRADLPGAGEGRRRPGQARLGGLQGHVDRAMRAGRRLLHHPRRRATRLRAADRKPRHRDCFSWRQHHGEVVLVAAQGELPLRALRRDLRPHAQVRRVVLVRRRPAPRLDRRCERPRAVRRARNTWRN